jgi:hypothetical protein
VSITLLSSTLCLIFLGSLTSGCLSPEGRPKEVWTKDELVSWHREHTQTNPNLKKFGYAGSDDNYHYFITRPVDSFLLPRIPRKDLKIVDERPRAELKKQLYFYLVDPQRNFRRISND